MKKVNCDVTFRVQGQGDATDISLMNEDEVIQITLAANSELCKLPGYEQAVRKSVYEQWAAMREYRRA